MVLLIGQLQPHIKTKNVKSTIAARRWIATGLSTKSMCEAFASGVAPCSSSINYFIFIRNAFLE